MAQGSSYDTSIDALFFPHRLPPFRSIENSTQLERAWWTRPAWVLAQLAHLAYLQHDDAAPILTAIGTTDHRFYDHEGAQALLATWPAFSVLAFRGTELYERTPPDSEHDESTDAEGTTGIEWRLGRLLANLDLRPNRQLRTLLANDILADLRFEKCDLGGGCGTRVHRGFLRELDKLWPRDLAHDVAALAPSSVHVTGHSLGGALATLAGTRFPFRTVVTFGAPRVGRHVGRAFRAGRHVRYVLGDDAVPHLPPKMPFRFHHHGERKLLEHPSGVRDMRFDHAITNYVSSLASHTESIVPGARSPESDQSA